MKPLKPILLAALMFIPWGALRAADTPTQPNIVFIFADDAVTFIKANAGAPFFINVWLHESHTPHVPTKESMQQWKHLDEQQQVYAAVITDGDNSVGKILTALKDADVEANTILMFSSDNGPESIGTNKNFGDKDGHTNSRGYGNYYSISDTGGLRGRKRSLFEGGVRVPFIVRCPATLRQEC